MLVISTAPFPGRSFFSYRPAKPAGIADYLHMIWIVLATIPAPGVNPTIAAE